MYRWYTPIHEARDACKQQLIDFKKEIKNLEEQRKSLKRKQKKKTTEKEDGENPQEGEGTSTDKAEKINENDTTEKNMPEKVVFSTICSFSIDWSHVLLAKFKI